MAADRRIGPAGSARDPLHQAAVERLAHAMQALELVARDSLGALDDRGDGQRVVGRELREDARPQRKEALGAGHVIQVGHRLAGEHRIVVEAALLGALHLGVPVGALDEAHHQPAIEAMGGCREPVDHGEPALLIGLDRQPEAVPPGKRLIRQRRRDHVERQLEPVCLLGIDGEVEVVIAGLAGERDDAGHELGENAIAAHRLVAGMERRELDRDAGALRQRLVAGGAPDRLDGRGVGFEIAVGVLGGARAFAEHVEGIAIEPAGAGLRRARAPRRSSGRARNGCP